MNKDQVIAILRQNEAELHRRGVKHAALFGSVARGEAGPNSDIDILIELEPDPQRSFYVHMGVKRFVAELFPGRVDVVNRQALKPGLAAPVEKDMLHAF